MNEMNGHDIEDLQPGMSATFSKTITEADIVLFAGVSGDNNAVHVNEEFAAGTAFGGRIAHGRGHDVGVEFVRRALAERSGERVLERARRRPPRRAHWLRMAD